MPASSANKATSSDSKEKPFPLRLVFLAALAPALLGVFCAGFIAPPMLSPDTANGLFAWHNFVEGGTWNTIRTVDPANIAQSVEYPVSWWAPGQYVPLGLLHSAGLRLGTGIIIISTISILIFGLGVAALAHVMKAPQRTLPWITLSACASYYMLYPFGFFIGGEVAQITVWPWAIFTAWTLRKRTAALIIILSSILLIGAFGKHSFAIYALTILAFLWAEAFRDSAKLGMLRTLWGRLWSTTLTLCAVGVLFLLGRYILIDTSHTPGTLGITPHGFLESWGYSFCGPLLGVSGVDRTLGYISYQFFTIKGEDLWVSLGTLLSVLTLPTLYLYGWLISRKSPIERLTGSVALTAGVIFFILLWRGGAISLESRHYQPAAILFLLVLGARALEKNRVISIGSRILLSWVVLFGCGTLIQRHIKMRSPQSASYSNQTERLTLGNMPKSVQESLEGLASLDHSLIVIDTPAQGNALYKLRHPTTRFLLVDNETEYTSDNERYGRVPRLVIALQNREVDKSRAKQLRESFRDYREDEWSSHELDGWVIWQAGDAVAVTTNPSQS